MLHFQLNFCVGKPADNVAAETVAEGELWSLFMTLKSLCEPAAIHNDNMGFLDGFLGRRRRWAGPNAERGTHVDKNIGTCSREPTRRRR